MGTVWFYQNIATNKQNTYYTKTVATPCKCHKYTPETQKRGKQLPLVVACLPMCRFFRVYIPFLSHKTYKLVEAFFLSCRL